MSFFLSFGGEFGLAESSHVETHGDESHDATDPDAQVYILGHEVDDVAHGHCDIYGQDGVLVDEPDQ